MYPDFKYPIDKEKENMTKQGETKKLFIHT